MVSSAALGICRSQYSGSLFDIAREGGSHEPAKTKLLLKESPCAGEEQACHCLYRYGPTYARPIDQLLSSEKTLHSGVFLGWTLATKSGERQRDLSYLWDHFRYKEGVSLFLLCRGYGARIQRITAGFLLSYK